MAFWRRKKPPKPEMRSAPWPTISVSDYASYFNGQPHDSLQKVAVWSSIDLICSLGSELPIDVFVGDGAQRREVPMSRHRWLEDPAGDGNGLEDWVYQLLFSWLMRGNSYGIVLDKQQRAQGEVITQMDLLSPDDVSPQEDDPGNIRWHFSGREMLRGTDVGQLVHRRVNPTTGRLLGMSPVQKHMATTIGLGLAALSFGSQWFTDGGHPSALLTNEESPIDEPQARTVKQRFLAAMRGNREPVIFGKGWKYEAIQINPEESQFLETQKYTSAECARIFGPGIAEVLGYETGGSLTYSNTEAQSAHLLKYSLNKWFRRVERTLGLMLPPGQYARINRDAMMQAITLDRYRAHASALDKRWRTVNEVRAIEDLAPVAWGDEPNPTPGAAPDDDDEPSSEGGE